MWWFKWEMSPTASCVWVLGTVWGGYGTFRWYRLAGESMSKGVGFKGLLPCPASCSFILLPVCGWDVISQLLAPALVGIWLSGAVKQNMLFLKLLWDVVFHHSSRESTVPSVLKQRFSKMAHGACASNPTIFLWVSHVFWNTDMLLAFIRFAIFSCYTVEYKEEIKMLFNTKICIP